MARKPARMASDLGSVRCIRGCGAGQEHGLYILLELVKLDEGIEKRYSDQDASKVGIRLVVLK
jgi:hypothetical protein